MADTRIYPETPAPETPLPVFPDSLPPGETETQRVDSTSDVSDHPEFNVSITKTASGESSGKKILVKEKNKKVDEPKPAEDLRRVVLNVGGTRHESSIMTLSKFPQTRLGRLASSMQTSSSNEIQTDPAQDPDLPELFFDRDPVLFGFILNFYRTGQLHVPLGVCGPMFKTELDFWQLDDREIEPCCFVTYVSYEETNEALAQFDYSVTETQQYDQADRQTLGSDSCWQRFRPKLWKGLQSPYTSTVAMVYAIISVLLVLVSIAVFVVETLPYFGQHTLHSRKEAGTEWTSADLRHDLDIFSDISNYDILIIIDNGCNAFFFVEYMVKLLAAPSKKSYIGSPISVIELLCIIPYYMAMAIVFWHHNPIELFDLLRVLYATRVLRIFRIFVLMKHFMALKILVYTIKASTKELLLLVLILLIGVIIFACMEYYAELLTESEGNASDFPNIPIAFWWALVTMTTVGYGDVYPRTWFGYIVGAGCAISGVLVVALTVPIIVNNFSVYYTHAQSREKLKLRKKQLEDSTKAKNQWKKAAGVSWSFGVFRHRSRTGSADDPCKVKNSEGTTKKMPNKFMKWLRSKNPNKVSGN